MWDGGSGDVSYRDMIEKEECKKCGSKEQLLILHINEDHYDNRIENLEVLCSPCHTSMHKKKYWEEVRQGLRPPMRTNKNRKPDGTFDSDPSTGSQDETGEVTPRE
jgi:hypothetical protein